MATTSTALNALASMVSTTRKFLGVSDLSTQALLIFATIADYGEIP